MAGRGERLVRTANGGGERRKQPIIAVVVVRRSDGAWFHFVIEDGRCLSSRARAEAEDAHARSDGSSYTGRFAFISRSDKKKRRVFFFIKSFRDIFI